MRALRQGRQSLWFLVDDSAFRAAFGARATPWRETAETVVRPMPGVARDADRATSFGAHESRLDAVARR